MKRSLPLLLTLLCAAILILGLVQLFKLRFETGDVYPPYSSLRSDPLGTMAFFESLEKLPGLSVRRDLSAANRLPDGKGITYLHLAADREDWHHVPDETFREIDQFLARGGRLAITLYPESLAYREFRSRDRAETNSESAKIKNHKETGADKIKDEKKSRRMKKRPLPEEAEEAGTTSLRDHWGVDFKILGLAQGNSGNYEPVPVRKRTELALPAFLDWHSGIVFTNLDPGWRVIYTRGTNAVVIERTFGRGTAVIATDSYFLSNEALQKNRHADLLAWLIGPNRSVVFDEAHLGVMEAPGVSTLMRQYRLHWLMAGLLLLAGLFLWKNSASLAPPHEDERRRDYVAGKDSAAGFVNLLRRSVPPRELFPACFVEWKKSVGPGKYSAARLQQAEAAFQAEQSAPAQDRDAVRAAQTITTILQARNPELKT